MIRSHPLKYGIKILATKQPASVCKYLQTGRVVNSREFDSGEYAIESLFLHYK